MPTHLGKRTIEAIKPADKPWIAWDDKPISSSVHIQPSGIRSYIANYCVGGGGRKAANRRVVIGRHGCALRSAAHFAGSTKEADDE